MSDPAQWFERLGNCPCGKRATGTLRGTRNESLNVYCGSCANKRIKKAQKDRDRVVSSRNQERIKNQYG